MNCGHGYASAEIAVGEVQGSRVLPSPQWTKPQTVQSDAAFDVWRVLLIIFALSRARLFGDMRARLQNIDCPLGCERSRKHTTKDAAKKISTVKEQIHPKISIYTIDTTRKK